MRRKIYCGKLTVFGGERMRNENGRGKWLELLPQCADCISCCGANSYPHTWGGVQIECPLGSPQAPQAFKPFKSWVTSIQGTNGWPPGPLFRRGGEGRGQEGGHGGGGGPGGREGDQGGKVGEGEGGGGGRAGEWKRVIRLVVRVMRG